MAQRQQEVPAVSGGIGDEILTVAQAAASLKLSTSAVYRALEGGRMPGSKPLGRWRIRRSELDAWYEEQRPRARSADPMPKPCGRKRRGDTFLAEVVEMRRARE